MAISCSLQMRYLTNTSANSNICKTIAQIHKQQNLETWNHKEQQFMYVSSFVPLPFCPFPLSALGLGHVINLANINVMCHIMNIAAVENKTAIWEFEPVLP
jgi:hypothetical protein